MKQGKRVGILLAGGKSRRYGSPKAFAMIDDKYFYEVSYNILSEVCDHVVIVTRKEFVEHFSKSDDVISDMPAFAGCGPLAGIYSAMEHHRGKYYVVLPCDMPLLTVNVIRKLLSYHTKDVTIVVSEGYKQPLVSIWNERTKRVILTALQSYQYKVSFVLDRLEVTYVDGMKLTDSPYIFMNINTLQEDEEMRKWRK